MVHFTAQKMKFSVINLFSKCEQICTNLIFIALRFTSQITQEYETFSSLNSIFYFFCSFVKQLTISVFANNSISDVSWCRC